MERHIDTKIHLVWNVDVKGQNLYLKFDVNRSKGWCPLKIFKFIAGDESAHRLKSNSVNTKSSSP